jgi:hypothetical protein
MAAKRDTRWYPLDDVDEKTIGVDDHEMTLSEFFVA